MNDGLEATVIRQRALAHASNLEYVTIGWNILEGVIAVLAAHAAGSVALLGFGIDSVVESASGGVLLWRLAAEAARVRVLPPAPMRLANSEVPTRWSGASGENCPISR